MEGRPQTACILLLLAGLGAPVAGAQESTPGCNRSPDAELITDRPDATESAATVPAGCWQVEAGATGRDVDGVAGTEVRAWGEVLLRRGIGERLELRVGVPSYIDPEIGEGGFEDATLGVKWVLAGRARERPARPRVALLVDSTVPTGDTELREPHARPSALLALAWPLGARSELAANVGAAYASVGGEQFGQVLASAAVGRALTERLDGFVELFGTSRDEPGGSARGFFDAGLTWAVTPDLQLDLRAGIELESEDAERLVGFGLVWRQ